MIQLHRRLKGTPDRPRRRGQGLVEFALILPVIMLLLLMTIDFGRALYGWVVLQNSARIAANFAGLNADGWRDNIPSVKTRYANEIISDLKAANCDSFGSGAGGGTPPDPVFVDGPDTPDPAGPTDTVYDVGDSAQVSLTCTFHPVTPIISAILGNNIQLGASSEFKIRSGTVTGLAFATQIPPPATPTPTPGPTSTATATPTCSIGVTFSRAPTGNNIVSGTAVTFTPVYTASNCSIVSYSWTFPNGSPASSTSATPPVVTFTSAANVSVTVTVVITSSSGTTAQATDTFHVRP